VSQVALVIPQMVKLASMLDEKQLSSTAAKTVLNEIVTTQQDPEVVAKNMQLLQVSDETELVMIVEKVLSDNQKAADDVRSGEMKAIGFLVGQVMKQSQGRANPAKVQELIKKQLGI
ncbi:Asp-tRNA(Asn)/Glu-tRNA(Gln) amidotransferase subunit GatB, partial [Candidatus Saccharibacteria bacterium]|nr:Asp-tRNA(Asn)/Glu-tRNA(Gln) amidotransferase subunit GatB [Candidatus Saccharibacteria bacterium]